MTNPPGTRNFEEIVRETQVRVRTFIASLGIAPADVDDLAQETFLQLYRNIEKIPREVPPEVWVMGIAKNVCLNHLRKAARRGRLHRHALAEILANTKTDWESPSAPDAVGAALADCLTKLPAQRRQMVELRYVNELTSDAIAQKTQSTAEAVRVTLHRIRAGLRDCITQKLAKQP